MHWLDGTRSYRHTLIGAFLALAASPGVAEIYKCTDTEGRITFSEEECGSNAEVIQLEDNTTTGFDLRIRGDWPKADTDIPHQLESGPEIERYQRLIRQLMEKRDSMIQ